VTCIPYFTMVVFYFSCLARTLSS